MRAVSRHLRKPQTAFQMSLGPLEARIMTILWTCGECSVCQVQEKLPSRAAYTTVLTTMTRLHQKGLLQRRKRQNAFIYSAVSPERWGLLAVSEFLAHFVGVTNGPPDLLVSLLSEAISQRLQESARRSNET